MKHLVYAIVALIGLLPLCEVQASPAHVPQTGQAACYSAAGDSATCSGTGQDGEKRAGLSWPSPRFADNSIADPADQTVTDSLTGLVWTKDANLLATRDPALDADGTPGDGMVTWQHGLEYVARLNAENYLGHTDWRMPSINELKSLLHRGEPANAGWLAGQGFVNIPPGFPNYWSSSTVAATPASSWAVDLAAGTMFEFPKGTEDLVHIWPVRGQSPILPATGQTGCYGPAGTPEPCSGIGQDGDLQAGVQWPSPRFSANGNQTVTDTLTGIVWSTDANPAAAVQTWQQALDFVAALNAAGHLGHSDWRLPNVNELATLVHYGESNTAAWLATNGFSNVGSASYWSSTSDAGLSGSAWIVDLGRGATGRGDKSGTALAWPIRGGYAGSVLHLQVSIAGTGSGTVTPDTGSILWAGANGTGDYAAGAVVTLTAAPGEGSYFAGWAGACSGTGPCTVTMSEARSVTATFPAMNTLLPASGAFGETPLYSTPPEKGFTIVNNGLTPLAVTSVAFTGANVTQFAVSPGTCGTITPLLAPGAACTLSVTFIPTTQGAKRAVLVVSTDSPVTPAMEAQLTGTGVIPYYTLSVDSLGVGGGTVFFSTGGSCSGGCSQSFPENRQLQLTPLADQGSRFSGWSGCDSVTGDTCTVVMTGPRTVAATFDPAPSVVEQWLPAGPGGVAVTALALTPQSPATIFVAVMDGTGLYRSTDGGATWIPAGTGLTDPDIVSLAVNPATPAALLVDTRNAGLFRSDDGGDSWNLLAADLKGARALVFDPGFPQTVYASGCGGVCKSSDGGVTWFAAVGGMTAEGLMTDVTSLAIDPVIPTTLYAAARQGEGMYGGLFKTTDGGTSWTRLDDSLVYGINTPLAVDPVTPATLYMGTAGGGVYKSTDAGATWNATSNGLGNLTVRAVAVNPGAPSVIYAGTEGGMYRSTDGGANWFPLAMGLPTGAVTAVAIDPTTPSAVFAGTGGAGVFRLALVPAVPVIGLSPSARDFGAVATSSSSATTQFSLTNSGNTDLHVTSVSIGGANRGEFSLLPGSCPSLAPLLPPGASCTVEVTFVPTSTGAKAAALTVVSTDPASPVMTASLTGYAYDPPPVGIITINGGDALTGSTSVALSVAAFDNSGTVADMRFSNNNSSWSDWEMYGAGRNWTLSTLGGDGVKTVYVQFRDAAGNVSGSFADSITLDTTAPASTITSMPAPFYPAAEGSFTFAATESATFQCRIDSAPPVPCTSPFTFTGLADGNHTFGVRATDVAGNVEPAEATYTFTTDTAVPTATITGQPPLLSPASAGTFTFSSSEPFTTYHCKVDSGMWGYCSSSYTYTGLADGSHTFSVRAIDRAGNSDLATYTWTIDTTPPDTTLSSVVNGSTATFLVGSPDPTASLECSLDGAPWSACSGSVTFSGLAYGSHTFAVRATDSAGNTDPTPAAYTWTNACAVRDGAGTCYATVAEALQGVAEGGAVLLKAVTYDEDVTFAVGKAITVSGGYGPDFEPPAAGAMTTVRTLTIASGAMTVDSIVMK